MIGLKGSFLQSFIFANLHLHFAIFTIKTSVFVQRFKNTLNRCSLQMYFTYMKTQRRAAGKSLYCDYFVASVSKEFDVFVPSWWASLRGAATVSQECCCCRKLPPLKVIVTLLLLQVSGVLMIGVGFSSVDGSVPVAKVNVSELWQKHTSYIPYLLLYLYLFIIYLSFMNVSIHKSMTLLAVLLPTTVMYFNFSLLF